MRSPRFFPGSRPPLTRLVPLSAARSKPSRSLTVPHASTPPPAGQVLGLWVILGLALLVGAVLLGLMWFRAGRMQVAEVPTQVARAVSHTLSRVHSRAPSVKRRPTAAKAAAAAEVKAAAAAENGKAPPV